MTTTEMRRATDGQKATKYETRTLTLFALLIIAVVTLLAVVSVAIVYRTQTRIREQAEQTRAVVLQNRDQLAGLLCAVAANEAVQLEGLRTLARTFGVEIGPIPGEATQCSTPGDDVFIGSDRGDTMRGTPGRDFMSGQGGNDLIAGRHGDDAVFGQDGNDDVYGGYGADKLYGGVGNDVLYARAHDGRPDVVDGGAGNDKCIVDGNDRVIDCEQVSRS